MLANSFVVTGFEKVSKSLAYNYHMGALLKPYSVGKKDVIWRHCVCGHKAVHCSFWQVPLSKAILSSDGC